MNFLNNLLPPSAKKEAGTEELPITPEDETDAEKEGEKKEEAIVARKKSN